MIARCVYCPAPHVTAIKPPFFDFRISHGMCELAAQRAEVELRRRAGRRADLFFGSHIEDLRQNGDGPVTPGAERIHTALLASLSSIMATPKEGYLTAPDMLESDLERVVAVVKAAYQQRVSGRGTLHELAQAVDRLRGRTPGGSEVDP